MLLNNPQMPPGIIATHLSIANFSIQESTILCRSPLPKRENRRKSSSGDYPSVSFVPSYAHSVVSSNFTLSSGTTDGSSAPSSIFDHNKPRNEPQDECVFEPA
ncbi:hypothetical protein V8E52_003121, partial [Russula decolorans]